MSKATRDKKRRREERKERQYAGAMSGTTTAMSNQFDSGLGSSSKTNSISVQVEREDTELAHQTDGLLTLFRGMFARSDEELLVPKPLPHKIVCEACGKVHLDREGPLSGFCCAGCKSRQLTRQPDLTWAARIGRTAGLKFDGARRYDVEHENDEYEQLYRRPPRERHAPPADPEGYAGDVYQAAQARGVRDLPAFKILAAASDAQGRVTMSNSRLAVLNNTVDITAGKALRRLQEQGWLVLVEDNCGQRPRMFRLQVPPHLAAGSRSDGGSVAHA